MLGSTTPTAVHPWVLTLSHYTLAANQLDAHEFPVLVSILEEVQSVSHL